MSAALHIVPRKPGETPISLMPRAMVADLPANARLLLWALRLLAQSQANRDVLRQELWLCCGPADVETALASLEDMIALLARDGRRPLLFKPADAKRMTACEESLLALFDAATERDDVRQAAHARWLARPLAQCELLVRMRHLARSFAGV